MPLDDLDVMLEAGTVLEELTLASEAEGGGHEPEAGNVQSFACQPAVELRGRVADWALTGLFHRRGRTRELVIALPRDRRWPSMARCSRSASFGPISSVWTTFSPTILLALQWLSS